MSEPQTSNSVAHMLRQALASKQYYSADEGYIREAVVEIERLQEQLRTAIPAIATLKETRERLERDVRLLEIVSKEQEARIAELKRGADETPAPPDLKTIAADLRELVNKRYQGWTEDARLWMLRAASALDGPVTTDETTVTRLQDDERLKAILAGRLCEWDGVHEPDQIIWEGHPPEPWGPVWMRYEPRAREILGVIDDARSSVKSTGRPMRRARSHESRAGCYVNASARRPHRHHARGSALPHLRMPPETRA